MDCKEVEDQLPSYLLGALDSGEIARVDKHVDGCSDCKARLREEGSVVAQLAYAVPRLEAPPPVRARLFSRVDADLQASGMRPLRAKLPSISMLASLGRRFAPQSAFAAAVGLAVAIVIGGNWYNDRLNTVAAEKEALAAKIETVVEEEAQMEEKLHQQQDIVYMIATPGNAVRTLSAMNVSSEARGMIVVSANGPKAAIWAMNLPTLARGQHYRVWILKGPSRHDAGAFEVDSTGSGMAKLMLPAPLDELDGIVITIEASTTVSAPSGTQVLKSDL